MTVPAVAAISARTCLRSWRTSSADGGSPASQSLVSRPAPSGSETATPGSSSTPAAISSEPPPMSSISSRPDDQPNQRRAARNVSRDSSAPGSTRMSTRVSVLDPGEQLVAVVRVPHRRGRERQQLLHSLVLRDAQRLVHEVAQLHRAFPGQPVRGVKVVAEPQLSLVRERGNGPRALVCVNDKQMDGVGPDVQDPQAHTKTLPPLAQQKGTVTALAGKAGAPLYVRKIRDYWRSA